MPPRERSKSVRQLEADASLEAQRTPQRSPRPRKRTTAAPETEEARAGAGGRQSVRIHKHTRPDRTQAEIENEARRRWGSNGEHAPTRTLGCARARGASLNGGEGRGNSEDIL